MTTTTGETAVKRYIRTPPPGSGVQLANGWPVDRTVMTLASNVAWMGQESCRHLVYSTSQTSWKFDSGAYDVFNGIVDFTPPTDPVNVQLWQEIPWDRRCAMRFGPFFGIPDQLSPDGFATLRNVTVSYTYGAPVTPPYSYVAMTSSSSPADLYSSAAGGLAFQKTLLLSGNNTIKITLVPNIRISLADLSQRPADSAAAVGATTVAVYPFWLWLGVKPFGSGGGGSVYIDNFDAWESR